MSLDDGHEIASHYHFMDMTMSMRLCRGASDDHNVERESEVDDCASSLSIERRIHDLFQPCY